MPKMIGPVNNCGGCDPYAHSLNESGTAIMCSKLRYWVNPDTIDKNCPLDDAPEPVWGCHAMIDHGDGVDLLALSCDYEEGEICVYVPKSGKKEDCPHWRVVGKDGE